MTVVRLADTARVPMAGTAELCEFMRNWADALESGAYGDLTSVVILLESKDGGIGKVSQCTERLDKCRLVGIVQMALHRIIDGNAEIDEWRHG